MEKSSKNNSAVSSQESRSKKRLFITVLLIAIAITSPFLIYWTLQLSLNTSSPMVVVVSGSMEPTLSRGDLLFINGKNPADIRNGSVEKQNGDIIVFDAHGYWDYPPAEPVVHRVINKTYQDGEWWFKTKGDANNIEDPWIPETQILGVVCGVIPYIGWVKIFFTESGLLIPLIIIVLGVLIINLIWDFVKESDQEEESEKNSLSDEKKTNP